MKNYLVIALCTSLFLSGCEEDDGFRAVSIEVEFDAIQAPLNNNNDYDGTAVQVDLSSETPETRLFFSDYSSTNNLSVPSKVVKSEDVIWPVGTNVRRTVSVEGQFGGENKLACDVKIRIKSDNKVIWSHTVNKGDYEFEEVANLIIR